MRFASIRPDQPVITDEEAAALARAIVRLFAKWRLSDAHARALLGEMDQRTWERWVVGEIGQSDQELRARMAILIGIHKALRHLFTDPSRGYAWIRKPNAAFGGESALDVMLRGRVTDLVDVRSCLGWIDTGEVVRVT